MRNIIYCFIFSLYIVFSSGCMEPGISWTWNEYKASIKPALYYWYKNGASEEQKTKDWVECGGYKDGTFSPYIGDLKKEQRANEYNTNGAYDRLHAKLQKCMKNKGYVH